MKVRCPSCGNEVAAGDDQDLSVLTCPRCEGEIPVDAVEEDKADPDEIAPGLKSGDRLGAYEVQGLLGSGGMALVMKGKQLSLNRTVAIKILPKRFSKNKLFVSRFYSEAAALAELNHPNIVSVIDRGEEEDTYFIVMEYIDGEDLRERLAEKKRLSQEEAIRIIVQVLSALDYAHSRNVVHRDIKPGNVMFNAQGTVKVTDFGLAHLASERSDVAHTRTGQTMGTLKYMAPEQLRDTKNVDGRADLYSTGVVLYELLTGQLPVGAFRMATEIVPDLDHRIDDIILKSLRTEPEDRFRTAADFANALQRVLDQPAATAKEKEPQELEVDAGDVTIMRLTACTKCGYESEKTSQKCEECGADLSHLFEPCPQCNTPNRVDVSTCPGCSFNLKMYRKKAAKAILKRQKKIKELVSDYHYNEALAELQKLANLKGFLYEQVRKSAKAWIPNVEKRAVIRNQQLYDAAKRMQAESNFKKALELLNQLPTEYTGVTVLKQQAEAQLEQGEELRGKAQEAYNRGDLQGALDYWKQAAEVWPRDADIRNNIVRLQNAIANRKMAMQYFEDAHDAADKQNFLEAIALCQRAVDLMPDNEDARNFLHQLQSDQSDFVDTDALQLSSFDSSSAVRAPRGVKHVARNVLMTVGIAAAIAALVLLVIAILPKADELAADMVAQARLMESQGNLETALKQYREAVEKYPGAPAAEEATAAADKIEDIIERCKSLLLRGDALARQGQPSEAGAAWRKLIKDTALSQSLPHVAQAKKRIDDLANELTKKADELITARQMVPALTALRAARDVLDGKSRILTERIATLERQIETFDRTMREARTALDGNEPRKAEQAIRTALALQPEHPDLPGMVDRLLTKLDPPEGMVYVPLGSFMMGSDQGDPDEAPQRAVNLTYGYYIDTVEVTNAAYAAWLADAGATAPTHWEGGMPGTLANVPVVNVSAAEAAAFAAAQGKRLPTEIEWERAARGSDARIFPWGSDWRAEGGVFSVGPAASGLHRVDVSPAGCREMAGNVSEWTATPYVAPKPTAPATAEKPEEQPEEPMAPGGERRPGEDEAVNKQTDWRVVKGGSWAGPEKERRVHPVFAASDGPGIAERVIVDDENPVRGLLSRSDTLLSLVGKSGSRERQAIVIHKWLPEMGLWASDKQTVPLGEAIGKKARVKIKTEEGDVFKNIDFSTGYTFVGLKGKDDEILIYTDATGAKRELMKGVEPRIPIGGTAQETTGEMKTLAHTARAANRLKAPTDGRFANVGFRCVKTPKLFQLLTPAQPDAAAAE